jgi:hypothetical protein
LKLKPTTRLVHGQNMPKKKHLVVPVKFIKRL